MASSEKAGVVTRLKFTGLPDLSGVLRLVTNGTDLRGTLEQPIAKFLPLIFL